VAVSEHGASDRLGVVSERLEAVLGEPLVGGVRQLSGGASRETFELASASRGNLVAQVDRQLAADSDSPPQAALLAAAAQAGVPVARVVAHGRQDPVLGNWIVLEAIAGTTDPTTILAGEGVPDAPQLLQSIAAALAAVHRMPADPALAPAVEDPLALLRSAYEELGEPHPTFELAFGALATGRPPARRALVHGDFRIGNLLVAEGGVSGVLDWELAHLGDPVEDLGWLCVPAWRFTRPDRPAAGLGTRQQLIEAYAKHTGTKVDISALRWWELAGTLRWGVICVMQAFKHLSGATRSVEHAVIGRRACEVEWDLLEQLDPRPVAAPWPQDAPAHARLQAQPRLHDRPTALELLDAARGALGDDVLPLLHARAAFQLRVSLRALGIVRRELAHAEQHSALHAAALSRLGVADEAELASAIRRGDFAGREQELYPALRATVRAKLEVANPAYLQSTSKASAIAKEAP